MKPLANKYILLFTILFSSQLFAFGQSTFGIKLKTFSINPAGISNEHLAPFSIDNNGRFTVEPGLVLSYESFILEDVNSIVFKQGGFIDAAKQFAGFTHIGFKTKIWNKWQHSINIGVGPTLYYRSTWEDLDNYKEDKRYSSFSNWQYKALYFSGGMEYNYNINRKWDLSASLFYDHYEGASLYFGFRYWISRKIKHKRGCNC